MKGNAHLGQQFEPLRTIQLVRSPYPSVKRNAQVAIRALLPCRLLWDLAARSLEVAVSGPQFCEEEAALAAHAALAGARLAGSCHGEQRLATGL